MQVTVLVQLHIKITTKVETSSKFKQDGYHVKCP